MLEDAVTPSLQSFCDQKGYYLDFQAKDRAARSGKKVTWKDGYGNKHDLDFVIELGGTDTSLGRPIAFIEAAWRRYTKHSKNKAQEIQGALLPIAEKHCWDKPFLGVIFAGIFTDSALEQLQSNGFEVLYFPYETIVSSFAKNGVDVRFDEITSNHNFQSVVDEIEAFDDKKILAIRTDLLRLNKTTFDTFLETLKHRLDRMIDRIDIIPLHGNRSEFTDMKSALVFISEYDASQKTCEFQKFELCVRFTNGDEIKGEFSSKTRATEFLEYMRT